MSKWKLPLDSTGLGKAEQKSVLLGTLFRIVGTPAVALIGLANTALIVRQTGEAVFGLVSLVTTFSLLLPFADLGIGAVVTTACSRSSYLSRDRLAVNTIRRAVRVLGMVAAGIVGLALVLMATNSWAMLLGSSSGSADRYAITAATILFALGIPAGIGIRILVGIDRNHIAVLLTMVNSLFTLASTCILYLLGVPPIWYAVSGAAGVLAGSLIASVVAFRASGLSVRTILEPPDEDHRRTKLLAGSLWIFVASVGLPLGLQSHRIILSHVSSPEELSKYALMAQVYAICWMVFSTAGVALWPVFVKRRADPKATMKLLLAAAGIFAIVAAMAGLGMAILGPWATGVLSGDKLVATHAIAVAFAALLVVQCLHLPAGVMLTTPREARFQSFCITGMAIISIVLGIWLGSRYGGVGVVIAATIAVLVAQLIPDVIWIPKLLRERTAVDWQHVPEQSDTVTTPVARGKTTMINCRTLSKPLAHGFFGRSIAQFGMLFLALVVGATGAFAVARERPAGVAATAQSSPARIAVIGDGWSSGVNGTTNWPSVFAEGNQYVIANVSRPYSGYVGGEGESGPFSAQLEQALAARPNLIVVFGGISDLGKSSSIISQAARDLFVRIGQRAPDAKLVVLGPMWHTPRPTEVAVRISKAVQAAADSVSVPFDELVYQRWLAGDGAVQPDEFNLTDAGQRTLAAHLAPLVTAPIEGKK